MYGKILLLLVACVAYAAADDHEGGHTEMPGMHECGWLLDTCMNQYNMASHNDWDNLQSYHDCVMWTDCSDDWTNKERKEAMMEDIKYMMEHFWDQDGDYDSSSHLGVPVTLLVASILLALRNIYA